MTDEQAIQARISEWLAASKEGDLETLAGLLDEEMLFTVAGRPPFGKREFLAGSPGKPHRFDARAEILEITVNGDWALSRIQLDIELAFTDASKPVWLRGPAMTVWRKSAGGPWRIWRDANLVAPVPD